MATVQNRNIILKLWHLLRTYILTLKRFDLFLQGALLVVILLDSNAYILLKRDAATGNLPGPVEDWVYMGAGGAEFLFGAFISWWGRRWRHLALAGWLAVTAASGLMVLAFPYDKSNQPNVELCGGDPIAPYTRDVHTVDLNVVPRVTFLITTAILCALTRVSIWAHGTTYLDDHEPENGPYFYGILISIRLSLGVTGVNWLMPGSGRDDWWEAHLSLSMLVLMFSVLYTLFPRHMPNYKKEKVDATDDGFFRTLVRLSRNKALIIQSLGFAFLNAALFGFIRYDDYYVQARFHIEAMREDPRTSRFVGDIFRSLVIIFFVSIFRVRFSMRRSDGVKCSTASRVGGVIGVMVMAFFVVLAALGCATTDIAGMVDEEYQQPSCSEHCQCNSEVYGFSPVCAIDSSTTFFSPCHAGCQQFEDLNGYMVLHNCTCGPERAVRGACTLAACTTAFSIYQIIFAIVLALTAASLLMQGMSVLRSVRRSDKPTAIGAAFALAALLTQILIQLLYTFISDATCAHSYNDTCVLHSSTLWSMPATSAALSLVSAVICIAASRVASTKIWTVDR